jgi:C4-type Zn-finger protein
MNEEESTKITSKATCPYCYLDTYRLTFIPYAGGLIVRGMCENCGLKGESMSEVLSQSIGFEVLSQIHDLELKE